jgi:hypothetical protein
VTGYGSLHYIEVLWTGHVDEIRVLIGPDYRQLGLGNRLPAQAEFLRSYSVVEPSDVASGRLSPGAGSGLAESLGPGRVSSALGLASPAACRARAKPDRAASAAARAAAWLAFINC